MRLFILLLFVPFLLNAQKSEKKSGWLADTLKIYPVENPCFDFSPAHLGTLVQKDNRNWWFYSSGEEQNRILYLPLYFYHSSPALFDDCVYFDLTENRKKAKGSVIDISNVWQRNTPMAAASLRFYMGNVPMQKNYDDELVPGPVPPAAVEPYYQPFYFRKTEVSNAEYREFVNWVRDSVVMRVLADNGFADEYLQKGWNDSEYVNGAVPPLNWKTKIHWDETAPEYKDVLQFIFLPVEKRFYHRKEINPAKLIYKFNNKPEDYNFGAIYIYPDTSSWINDFSYSFNEPMSNMYFWHPAYDNYPVVGLNYWQCLAFLEWKSKMLSQQLKQEKKNLKATCALPSEREWDMASTANKTNDQLVIFGPDYFSVADNSWLTDLRLCVDSAKRIHIYKGPTDTASYRPDTSTHSYSNRNYQDQIYIRENVRKPELVGSYHPDLNTPYQNLILHDERIPGNFISDGYFHTAPVNMELRSRKFDRKNHITYSKREKELASNERHQAHRDKASGIYYLDGNVSEWIREDLDSNWRSVFEKHQPVPKSPMFEQFLAVHSVENYFYAQLPKHGKLVRGCNWFDERYSCKFGKNTAGMNAKTFLDPEKAHCTVGFRYVIYVEPAN